MVGERSDRRAEMLAMVTLQNINVNPAPCTRCVLRLAKQSGRRSAFKVDEPFNGQLICCQLLEPSAPSTARCTVCHFLNTSCVPLPDGAVEDGKELVKLTNVLYGMKNLPVKEVLPALQHMHEVIERLRATIHFKMPVRQWTADEMLINFYHGENQAKSVGVPAVKPEPTGLPTNVTTTATSSRSWDSNTKATTSFRPFGNMPHGVTSGTSLSNTPMLSVAAQSSHINKNDSNSNSNNLSNSNSNNLTRRGPHSVNTLTANKENEPFARRQPGNLPPLAPRPPVAGRIDDALDAIEQMKTKSKKTTFKTTTDDATSILGEEPRIKKTKRATAKVPRKRAKRVSDSSTSTATTDNTPNRIDHNLDHSEN
ncbi:hypothetical protein B0T17DRAFT_6406 [Bombardia bombarda]|uniref:Uncharacterized protein n=1 Tax=Bombardia bombarda TaxID=252184 RepID=A0AA39XI39_9PEZI|nr:hypothetical protein B0T17DRAFT_6406 [Bombardia bombarda]